MCQEGDEDDTRMEMLFAVAILILMYFVVMLTFFKPAQAKKRPDQSQLFLTRIEEMYEFQQKEMQRKQLERLGDLPEEEKRARIQETEAMVATTKQAKDVACRKICDMMLKTEEKREAKQQLFIVVFLQNMKRMGEAILRWSFFTLNMFILTLCICNAESNTTSCLNAAGIPVLCPEDV